MTDDFNGYTGKVRVRVWADGTMQRVVSELILDFSRREDRQRMRCIVNQAYSAGQWITSGPIS